MVNDSIFTYLLNFFQQVYDAGDEIILINLNGITVNLNTFLICIAIFSIVISSLLNFAKTHTGDIGQMAGYNVKGLRKVWKSPEFNSHDNIL